jgi:hypothetical protein
MISSDEGAFLVLKKWQEGTSDDGPTTVAALLSDRALGLGVSVTGKLSSVEGVFRVVGETGKLWFSLSGARFRFFTPADLESGAFSDEKARFENAVVISLPSGALCWVFERMTQEAH